MSASAVDADVVVVGGGTAGLQAALQLARVGRSVVLLERRAEGKSGARWCNGTVAWQFERAGLAPPVAPELRAAGGAAHMISPTGAHRFTIGASPIGEVDMRALVDRLQRDAVAAGVDIRWGVTDIDVELTRGRPTSLTATQDGELLTVSGRLFVDAAGYTGVIRDQVPALVTLCPEVTATDLCSAQQLVLHVDDPEGARRYLAEQGAEPGDAIIAIGMAGGYSTVNINVDEALEEVAVLTGSIPALGHASGPELLKAVRDEHPWMGRTIFGGGGLIPLRRTYDRFTAPGIALVGDAACQVMPGHGSGIGFGLIAGKVLAEAVAGAADPGGPDVLWRYQASYLREFGGTLAGYDAIRRMSVKLGPDGVEELFASGVFSPALVLPGLDQKVAALGPSDTAAAARALAGRPRIAKVVVPALAALASAQALYRTYPRTPSPRAFATWAASSRALLPRQGAAG
ncbi:NAD(P)/FAD-dependent oxidoreductase [Aquihabitans sp. McL0605]|uniref:NAD(P)/FAD-dependent oxidoreductase n=1 Tax=Aquihabitans sp. McL0605 TaxID=3415671 RepID=UPI003CE8D127